MKYINDFNKSKTIKFARLKQLSGLVSLIAANTSYFEGSMAPWAFGCCLILVGFADEELRKITTKPLSQK